MPTEVGTTWNYLIYPEYSKERQKLSITKDSISNVDNSHYIFINNDVKPYYRIDSLKNVFYMPFGKPPNGNLLVLKSNAVNMESWAMYDSVIQGGKRVGRIKSSGSIFMFNRLVKYKAVEWGGASISDLDSFGLSRRTEYYAENYGLYFVIVEPAATERSLIGFISGKDTLGDLTKVLDRPDNVFSYQLFQNYPNPFNPTTKIEFSIPKSAFTKLVLYDVSGREVLVLLSGYFTAGQHTVEFNGKGLASGVYYYRLQSGEYIKTRKFVLLN